MSEYTRPKPHWIRNTLAASLGIVSIAIPAKKAFDISNDVSLASDTGRKVEAAYANLQAAQANPASLNIRPGPDGKVKLEIPNNDEVTASLTVSEITNATTVLRKANLSANELGDTVKGGITGLTIALLAHKRRRAIPGSIVTRNNYGLLSKHLSVSLDYFIACLE